MSGDQAEAVAPDADPTKVVTDSARRPPAAGMGRPKGAVNKTTALLKDAILMAAQKAGGGDDEGLVNYLHQQAVANPGPFLSLLGKVLPMTVAGDKDNPLSLVTRIELVAPRGNSTD
jgi:hypothetical protein